MHSALRGMSGTPFWWGTICLSTLSLSRRLIISSSCHLVVLSSSHCAVLLSSNRAGWLLRHLSLLLSPLLLPPSPLPVLLPATSPTLVAITITIFVAIAIARLPPLSPLPLLLTGFDFDPSWISLFHLGFFSGTSLRMPRLVTIFYGNLRPAGAQTFGYYVLCYN